jgi:hypothetical protein
MGFNEYAIGRFIGKQKIEGFDNVFSARLAKDYLKETQTQIGTVNKESLRQMQPNCGRLRKKQEEKNSNIWSAIIIRS